jgi:dihydroorotase
MTRLVLRRPDDWHLHLRDGAQLAAVLPHTAQRFARALVMPNLKPPMTDTAGLTAYRSRILAALPAGATFEPLMTLFLTDRTTPEEVKRASAAGFVVGAKLYPAGATTHSDAGVTSIERVWSALEAMAELGLVLQVHGEVTDPDVDVFDRESAFIERVLARVVERIPGLKIVFEHVTTRAAVEFVRGARPGVAATITPQHLLLNRNALFEGGLRPHHYCLPVLKREDDREALIQARPATSRDSSWARTARRTSEAPRKPAAAVRGFTRHTQVSSSTRRPSSRRTACSGSRLSPPSAARISTAVRAMAGRSCSRASLEGAGRYAFGDGTLVPLRAGSDVSWRLVAE